MPFLEERYFLKSVIRWGEICSLKVGSFYTFPNFFLIFEIFSLKAAVGGDISGCGSAGGDELRFLYMIVILLSVIWEVDQTEGWVYSYMRASQV